MRLLWRRQCWRSGADAAELGPAGSGTRNSAAPQRISPEAPTFCPHPSFSGRSEPRLVELGPELLVEPGQIWPKLVELASSRQSSADEAQTRFRVRQRTYVEHDDGVCLCARPCGEASARTREELCWRFAARPKASVSVGLNKAPCCCVCVASMFRDFPSCARKSPGGGPGAA